MTGFRSTRTAIVAVFMLLLGSSAGATRPCPPDIDCSGVVNVTDLLGVIGAWGQSGVPADVNGSGTVDVQDLLMVVAAWGPCTFNYGPVYSDTEAHQIGLEMLGPAGPLNLSQQVYDRIDRDLDLIRAAYPALASQTHTMAWAPNQLIVSVANPQVPDYVCHNAYYQVIDADPLFGTWYVLTFACKFNVPAMAQVYMAGAGASVAEPNGLFGGQNFWVPNDLGGGVWRWNIDDGFHDCTDGCDCHRYYIIDTDAAGNVSLISYTEQGASWCDFGTTK